MLVRGLGNLGDDTNIKREKSVCLKGKRTETKVETQRDEKKKEEKSIPLFVIHQEQPALHSELHPISKLSSDCLVHPLVVVVLSQLNTWLRLNHLDLHQLWPRGL